MNNKLLLMAALLVFLLIAPATAASYYKQNTTTDLKELCPSCTVLNTCRITVLYPNDTVLIDNAAMTQANAMYQNITLDSSLLTNDGIYSGYMLCDDTGATNASVLFGISWSGLPPAGDNIIIFFIIAFIAILALSLYTLIEVLSKFKLVEIEPKDIVYSFSSYFALFILYGMNLTYLGNAMIDGLLGVLLMACGFTNVVLPLILFVLNYIKLFSEMKIQQQGGGKW